MKNKNSNLISIIACVLCGGAFGFFVPSALVDAGYVTEGWRLPIAAVGGGIIGLLFISLDRR